MEKKDVIFTPILKEGERKGEKSSLYQTHRNMFAGVIRKFFTLFLLLLFIRDYYSGWTTSTEVYKCAIIGFGAYFILPYLLGLPLLSRRYRENAYPVVNALLVWAREGLSFRRPITTKVFTKEHLRKEFLIEDFMNVYLKYEATGDVGKKLKKIHIKPVSKYDTGEWIAVFQFHKRPIDGELKVMYT